MMNEHTETHRVETEADLAATFYTLLAAFGYEAVKAAWLEESGDKDRVAELERFVQSFIDVGYEFGDPTLLVDLHDEAVALLPEG